MTWFGRPSLARILMGAAFALTSVSPLHAQTPIWSEYAFISSTLGVSDSRICIGEGSRGELGCPTYAPTISPTGRINATAGLTVDSVSLTTTGTTWGYLSAAGSYLPRLNTTTVSTTALQISGTVTTCTASNAGTLRYSSSTTALELCTGTGWQVMGVGIPAGTISAFASTTCPTGWSEYTAARGRFLRGIDNGAGNDPAGTRSPGAVQADMIAAHSHPFTDGADWRITGGSNTPYGGLPGAGNGGNWMGDSNRAGVVGSSGGAETRPKNVAVTFCQFNGTSNGWNNPLSGGSTTAGGTTGQIQYKGSFAGGGGILR